MTPNDTEKGRAREWWLVPRGAIFGVRSSPIGNNSVHVIEKAAYESAQATAKYERGRADAWCARYKELIRAEIGPQELIKERDKLLAEIANLQGDHFVRDYTAACIRADQAEKERDGTRAEIEGVRIGMMALVLDAEKSRDEAISEHKKLLSISAQIVKERDEARARYEELKVGEYVVFFHPEHKEPAEEFVKEFERLRAEVERLKNELNKK